jgi:hypothetical protein
MNYLKSQIEKQSNFLISGLGTLITLVVSLGLIYFFLLPVSSGLSNSSDQIKDKKDKLNFIKESTNVLASVSNEEITELGGLLENLVPSNLDMLRFASLNEKIASSANVSVRSITITKIPAAQELPTGFEEGSVPVEQNITPLPTKVSVTYSSNFASMVTLVKLWAKADQFVGINSVAISSQVSGPLTYTITYDLPTSRPEGVATIDNFENITVEEKEMIKKLGSSFVFTATPSSKPVGKNDPFE